MKTQFLALLFAILTTSQASASKISGVNVKSVSDLTADGGTAADLTGTDKIYDLTHSQTLKTSIDNNVFGGGSSARTVNSTSSTSFTFAATDGSANGNNPLKYTTGTSAITATIPLNASTAIPIGSQIDLVQGSTGTVTFTPQSGVTLHSPASAMTPRVEYSLVSLIKIGTDSWNLSGDLSAGFLQASCSGCAFTTDGNFKVATFTTSGSITFSAGPATGATFDTLAVGGGAAGGGSGNNNGGGGAGDYIYTTSQSAALQTYTVTVGTGGAGINGNATPNSGTSSSITGSGYTTITAIGGGGGGVNAAGGFSGASGGGAGGGSGSSQTGGSATGINGHAGGNYTHDSNNLFPAAGGGGCGSTGGSVASSGSTGGAGGTGCSNSITGSSTFYAAGGGGAVNSGGTGGAGGSSIGGAGSASGNGGTGTANTGSGGGGAMNGGHTGGSGTDGVVIFRYQFQ